MHDRARHQSSSCGGNNPEAAAHSNSNCNAGSSRSISCFASRQGISGWRLMVPVPEHGASRRTVSNITRADTSLSISLRTASRSRASPCAACRRQTGVDKSGGIHADFLVEIDRHVVAAPSRPKCLTSHDERLGSSSRANLKARSWARRRCGDKLGACIAGDRLL